MSLDNSLRGHRLETSISGNLQRQRRASPTACTRTAPANKKIAMTEEPFLEHPTGEHETAIDAMEEVIRRLRGLPDENRWLTLCAQGQGGSPDAVRAEEIRLRRDRIEIDGGVDIAKILEQAKAPPQALVADQQFYSIAGATPKEAALILAAVFEHLGIRPFADEGDYAVGAEWLDP